MSDSSGLPPGIAGVRDTLTGRNTDSGQAVRLISAPASIIPEQQPVRIEGDIRDVSDQGRVRIETPRGDIIVEAREGVAQQLSEGQRVEVDIPPENFDRQARLRLSTEQAPIVQDGDELIAPERGDVSAQPLRDGGRVSAPEIPREEILNQTPSGSADIPARSLSVLETGQNIRLSALPEAAIQTLVPPQIDVQAVNLPSTQISSYDGANITNERYLQATLNQTQSNLFQNIAQIFGAAPPSAQNLPEVNLSGFLLTTLTGATQQFLTITANNLVTTTTIFALGEQAASAIQSEQTTISSRLESIFTQSLGQVSNLGQISNPNVITITAQESVKETPIPRQGQISTIQSQAAIFGGLQAVHSGGDAGAVARASTGAVANNVQNLGQQAGQNLFPSNAIQAQIVGITRDNLPVLQFTPNIFQGIFQGIFQASGSQSTLFIPDAQIGSFPVGTTLSLSAVGAEASAGINAVGSPLPSTIPQALQPGSWSVLHDIRQTLFAGNPQAAQANAAVTANAAVPGQISSAAMFFVAALRGGDLGVWLGSTAQNALRSAGKADLVDALKTEGRNISRAEAPQSSNWQSTAIPLLWDGDVLKVGFWTRAERDPDAQDEDGAYDATRFVFDMDFPKMGSVQIDGLVREQKLDIVLRTEKQFNPSMRQSMRRGYIQALEQTGFSGELHFHGRLHKEDAVSATDKNWSDLV